MSIAFHIHIHNTMDKPLSTEQYQLEQAEAQKRIRKIKKFYKELTSWAGTSVFLIAINIFIAGHITWAKYPVFFWGLFILVQAFEVFRLQRMDKEWEERQMRRFTGRSTPPPLQRAPPHGAHDQTEDYSEQLLQQRERELADLSEYRKLKRPWKDEDLV